jgi:hypothetical protein
LSIDVFPVEDANRVPFGKVARPRGMARTRRTPLPPSPARLLAQRRRLRRAEAGRLVVGLFIERCGDKQVAARGVKRDGGVPVVCSVQTMQSR